jgi:hypothetical protein
MNRYVLLFIISSAIALSGGIFSGPVRAQNTCATPTAATSGGLDATPRPFFCDTDVTPPAIALPTLLDGSSPFANANGNLFVVAVNFILNLLSLIGGIAAFGYALYGGFLYITAGPNASQVQQGKGMIVGAIIGILIMSLAFVLVGYVIEQVTSIFN